MLLRFYSASRHQDTLEALPGVLGIQGEGLFIYMNLGRRVIRDLGRKHNYFWGLGSREQGAEEKHFRELGRKVIFLSGSREQRHPPHWGPHFSYPRHLLHM